LRTIQHFGIFLVNVLNYIQNVAKQEFLKPVYMHIKNIIGIIFFY